MRILTGKEEKEAMKWIEEAAKVAADSLCLRAHCAAVIVKNGKIIGEGFNSPPANDPKYRTCLDEYEIPAGFRHDRTCCIHAEQRAIHDALKKGHDMKGATVYFVGLEENGEKKRAHRTVCTICSRAVLDAGITEFVLYWMDGVRSYDTHEFDQSSYEYKTPKKIS